MQPVKPSDLSGEALAKTEALAKLDMSPGLSSIAASATEEALAKGDGQLLAGFLQNRDESAFADLVKRHARVVMAACRMVLDDIRDAEEAFQNTFMVLVRKAHQHTGKESISGWLYRAAVWEALNIRSKRSIQARHIVEHKDAEMIAEKEPGSVKAFESMKGLLAEELNRLADKYSLPLILCYLEGKSAEQAARDLGLSAGALKVRLTRGRDLLRKRLVRRGITVSAGLLGVVLTEHVAESAEVVSEVLIKSTVRAAVAQVASLGAGVGTIIQILKGVLAVMTTKTTTAIIGGLVLLALVGSVLYLNKPGQKSVQVHENNLSRRGNDQSSTAGSNLNFAPELSRTIPASPGEAEKTVIQKKLPLSAQEYYKHFKEAMTTQGNGRWKILRELGINLTDAEFEAAWQTAQNDPRFNELFKHIAGLPGIETSIFSKEEAVLFFKFQDAIFSKWVANDPLTVITWARQLPEADYYYVSVDKGGILPEMTTWPGKAGFIESLVALWAKKDMDAAARWANEQPSGAGRETAQLGLAVAMSDKDAKGALELIEKENLLSKKFKLCLEIHYIFSNWALANRLEAVNYLNDLPSMGSRISDKGLIKDWGMEVIGYQWAKADLQGALSWVEKLPDAERNSPMGGIMQEWVKKDLNAAGAYATSMWEKQDSENNNRMLWKVAEAWLEKDPQSSACIEWAMQLSDKGPRGTKENLCGFICAQWARNDHVAAFNWIEQLPEGESKKDMWRSAAGGMVDGMVVDNELSCFKEGINLIDENFSEGDTRASLYMQLMHMWVQMNSSDDITDWIKTLPAGKDKDSFLSDFCFAQSISGHVAQKLSCSDLLQLASGMQDEKKRQEASEAILGRWVHEDSAAAKQWLQDSSLPQDVKDKLLATK